MKNEFKVKSKAEGGTYTVVVSSRLVRDTKTWDRQVEKVPVYQLKETAEILRQLSVDQFFGPSSEDTFERI